MDKETQSILHKYKNIHDLVGHDGWRLVRERLTNKVLDLQNAFNIEEATPERMLIDLQARKLASQILFDWLRETEGDAVAAIENKELVDKSYIHRV